MAGVKTLEESGWESSSEGVGEINILPVGDAGVSADGQWNEVR